MAPMHNAAARPMHRTLLLLLLAPCCGALRVLVTGAGGRTGSLVFDKLRKDYSALSPIGMVRSNKKAKKLIKAGAGDEQVVLGDVGDVASLTAAMEGCDTVVLCTSAVPKILPFSIAKLLFKKYDVRKFHIKVSVLCEKLQKGQTLD